MQKTLKPIHKRSYKFKESAKADRKSRCTRRLRMWRVTTSLINQIRTPNSLSSSCHYHTSQILLWINQSIDLQIKHHTKEPTRISITRCQNRSPPKRALPNHRRPCETLGYLWPILSICWLHLQILQDLQLSINQSFINQRLNEIFKLQWLQWHLKVQAAYLVQVFQANLLGQSRWESFQIMCKELAIRINSSVNKDLMQILKFSKEYSQSQKSHLNKKRTPILASSFNHQPAARRCQRHTTRRCTDPP